MEGPTVKVQVINTGKHPLPTYQTTHAAAFDLAANIEQPITLQSLERRLIPTGLHIALPAGYEAQIRPRSGLALKHGISLVNTPATIDADYRGEIGLIVINLSNESFTINDGDRIAQMVIARHETVEWEQVEVLDKTERGHGAFGHTGRQ